MIGNILWIASFDIGKKNFSFYIEEFDITKLNCIKNIPQNQRFNQDGTCTSNFNHIMTNISFFFFFKNPII